MTLSQATVGKQLLAILEGEDAVLNSVLYNKALHLNRAGLPKSVYTAEGLCFDRRGPAEIQRDNVVRTSRFQEQMATPRLRLHHHRR